MNPPFDPLDCGPCHEPSQREKKLRAKMPERLWTKVQNFDDSYSQTTHWSPPSSAVSTEAMTMDDMEKVARACALLEGENWHCWLVVANTALAALDIPAIKAAAYEQGREDAAKVCEAEQLLDPQDASDEGYMKAIVHCAAAIRAAP